MEKARVIAFYLPQYHPIKENNEWYGEGFTEWTNVGKAKPLFKGHYQPKVPADLGYYDLRIPEVREKQAELAKYAGISAFCYYHYWFGNGRRIMEMPIEEVVRTGKPDFPFCLCWANHSFYRKTWNSNVKQLDQELLIELQYLGNEDIKNHFYSLLHIFKDRRYLKIEDKLVFVLYKIDEIPDVENFICIWNELAKKEGLNGFYFLSYANTVDKVSKYPFTLANSVILDLINMAFTSGKQSYLTGKIKRAKEILGDYVGKVLSVKDYEKVMKYFIDEIMRENDVFPCILPNWDNSPRRGTGSFILENSEPKHFKKLLLETLELIKNKPKEKRVLFIKSWNEWGEGNYLEPDLKYGRGYLNVMHQVLCL